MSASWAVRLFLMIVAAVSFLPAGGADAQSAPVTFAYEGRGAASGMHLFYQPEGVLPTAAPVDFGLPHALSTINSTPTTFARASVADPGDLLARPEALIALVEPDWEPGTIPDLPLRAEASSSVGEPRAESQLAPGLSATAAVEPRSSEARAEYPGIDISPVITAGSFHASTSAALDGPTIEVTSHSSMGAIDILGLVTLGAVETTLVASSDGNEVTLSGGTVVTDAEVLGIPVVIDADGIRAAPGYSGPNPVVNTVADLLETAGIRISVATPQDLIGEHTRRRTSSGLRVELALSSQTLTVLEGLDQITGLLGQTLDELLPDSPLSGLLGITGARHMASIELASGEVDLSVVPLPNLDLPPPVIDTPPTAETPSLESMAPVAPSPGTAPVPPPDSVTEQPGPVLPSASPASASPALLGRGLGALALVGLLLQPFIGPRIANAAAAIAAGGQPVTCARQGM